MSFAHRLDDIFFVHFSPKPCFPQRPSGGRAPSTAPLPHDILWENLHRGRWFQAPRSLTAFALGSGEPPRAGKYRNRKSRWKIKWYVIIMENRNVIIIKKYCNPADYVGFMPDSCIVYAFYVFDFFATSAFFILASNLLTSFPAYMLLLPPPLSLLPHPHSRLTI